MESTSAQNNFSAVIGTILRLDEKNREDLKKFFAQTTELPLIIPIPSGYQLAQKIAKELENKYLKKRSLYNPVEDDIWVPTLLRTFADSDPMVEIKRHIRDRDVYIICDVESTATIVPITEKNGQRISHDILMKQDSYTVSQGDRIIPSDELIEYKETISRNFDVLSSTIDATRNAVKERGRITVILPFFPSSRQDRRSGRRSLDLKRRCLHLEQDGADHVMTIDIHNDSTELAFDNRTGFDALSARYTLVGYLKETIPDRDNLYLLAPDEGSNKRMTKWSNELDTIHHNCYKLKKDGGSIEVLALNGNPAGIKGKDVYIIDDMIDTAGTIVKAAELAHKCGAKSVHIISTHGVLSGPAITRLKNAYEAGYLNEVIITDSVTHSKRIEGLEFITVVSLARFIAKVIDAQNSGDSISSLLDD